MTYKITARPYSGFIEVDMNRKLPLLFKRSQKVIRENTACSVCGGIIRGKWDLYYYPAKRCNSKDRVCVSCGDS